MIRTVLVDEIADEYPYARSSLHAFSPLTEWNVDMFEMGGDKIRDEMHENAIQGCLLHVVHTF